MREKKILSPKVTGELREKVLEKLDRYDYVCIGDSRIPAGIIMIPGMRITEEKILDQEGRDFRKIFRGVVIP